MAKERRYSLNESDRKKLKKLLDGKPAQRRSRRPVPTRRRGFFGGKAGGLKLFGNGLAVDLQLALLMKPVPARDITITGEIDDDSITAIDIEAGVNSESDDDACYPLIVDAEYGETLSEPPHFTHETYPAGHANEGEIIKMRACQYVDDFAILASDGKVDSGSTYRDPPVLCLGFVAQITFDEDPVDVFHIIDYIYPTTIFMGEATGTVADTDATFEVDNITNLAGMKMEGTKEVDNSDMAFAVASGDPVIVLRTHDGFQPLQAPCPE